MTTNLLGGSPDAKEIITEEDKLNAHIAISNAAFYKGIELGRAEALQEISKICKDGICDAQTEDWNDALGWVLDKIKELKK